MTAFSCFRWLVRLLQVQQQRVALGVHNPLSSVCGLPGNWTGHCNSGMVRHLFAYHVEATLKPEEATPQRHPHQCMALAAKQAPFSMPSAPVLQVSGKQIPAEEEPAWACH